MSELFLEKKGRNFQWDFQVDRTHAREWILKCMHLTGARGDYKALLFPPDQRSKILVDRGFAILPHAHFVTDMLGRVLAC